MNTKISKVYKGSIADELGLETGDKIININGTEIKDIIDYRFLMADDYLEIDIEKKDGELWCCEVEKDYDEDFGVEFESAIMDNAKSCSNKCIFCFIDQLPKGMRETLYFKDDDSRLSFLQGNFVTLTNLKDEDIDRIIRYRISPINISVHTTNAELRKKMLNNRFAGNIYERLKKLASSGITMNCQIVDCPGFNDDEELIKTVEDLYKLYPSIQNVAVVPIGITKFREGLCKLNTFNKETAEREIKSIRNLQNRYIKDIGVPFVRLSDEFYVLADMEVPKSSFYGEFDQLEDGVGMIRYFRQSIDNTLPNLNKNASGSFTLVTGVSAYPEIKKAAEKINEVNSKIKVDVIKIVNNFFGETITVAGLLTGKDIMEQLKDKDINDYIILSRNMLKSGEKVLLDDVSIKDLENRLKKSVIICEYTGEDLIDLINKYSKEE